MLPILALLLQSGAPVADPAQRVGEIFGRIPSTKLFVRMDVAGFTKDDRTAKILQQALGARGILVGAIPEKLAMLEVIADKEKDKHLSDAEWRDLNLQGSGNAWKYFEAAGMSCGEVSILMEGSGTHDFHAFTVRAGYRFDVSLSETLSDQRAAGLPREYFEQLVGSFRLAVVRLGTWAQMPPAALELMDGSFKRPDDWKTWLDEQERARPDYSVPFAQAELLRFHESKPEEQIAAYRRAVELLEAKKEQGAPDRLAHATAEDGLALALLDSGDAGKAGPHLDAALKIAGNLTAPVRAAILYDQARLQSRLGNADRAVELLKQSEGEDTGAVDRARSDKEFEAVRTSKSFQELLAGDRKNR
jgi:tetratricopeptide (TPR) repeat protein